MIVFSYGMPKSASTFIYQIIKEILDLNGYSRAKFAVNMAPNKANPYQEFESISDIQSFESDVPAEFPFLIKTHSNLSDDMSEYLNSSRNIAFATYRDPLDIAISLYDVGVNERKKPVNERRASFASILTMDDAIARLPVIVEGSKGWLESDFVTKISYESVCNDIEGVFEQVTNTLSNSGLDITNVDKETVLSKFLSNKKSKIGEFNVGGVGRWKGKLSHEQVDYICNKYSDFRTKWIEKY